MRAAPAAAAAFTARRRRRRRSACRAAPPCAIAASAAWPSGWISPADMTSLAASSGVIVDLDDVGGRHEEIEAGRRVGRAGQEHRRHRLLPAATSATARAGSEEMKTTDHAPFIGNSTSPTLRNCVAALAEHGLEDLLEALVDAAHHRRAVDHRLADPDQRAAGDIGGEEAEQRQADEDDDDAEARAHGPAGRCRATGSPARAA